MEKMEVKFEEGFDEREVEKDLEKLFTEGKNLEQEVEQLFKEGDELPVQEVVVSNGKMLVSSKDSFGTLGDGVKIVKTISSPEPIKNENFKPMEQVVIPLPTLTEEEKREYVKVQQSERFFATKEGHEPPPTLFDDALPVLEEVGKMESPDLELTTQTAKLISSEMEKRGLVDRSHEVKDKSTTLFDEETVLKLEKDHQRELEFAYLSDATYAYKDSYCFRPINIDECLSVPVDFDYSFYKKPGKFSEMVLCTGSYSYIYEAEKQDKIDNLLKAYKTLTHPEREDLHWLIGRIASESAVLIVNKQGCLKNLRANNLILYLLPVNEFTTEFLIKQIDFILSNIQKDAQEDMKEDSKYIENLSFINEEIEKLNKMEFDTLSEEYQYKLVVLRKFPRV